MPWIGTWEGGRIWQDRKGTRSYVIVRMIDGRRYARSTRTSSYKAALVHLQRFESDPEGYTPTGLSKGDKRLLLDDNLIDAFVTFSEDEKGNTRQWALTQKRYLRWWRDQLRGRDLRRVSLRDELAPALDGTPNRRHKVEVIKALCSWLRSSGRMTMAEDASLALHVGAIRPEQWKRPKAVPQAHFDAVLLAIRQPWQDLLVVLAGTGWHVTELLRFCRDGEVQALPPGQRTDGADAVLMCPRHKSGDVHRTAVTAEVAEAAQRQRDRGGWSVVRFYAALRDACDKAQVPRFAPGQMRHTTATRAVEAGADPAAVAAFLGHRSMSTTKRFYATLAVVPRVQTMR